MDAQLIAIIAIFALLFILEQFEQKGSTKEEFDPVMYPGYINWSPHLGPGYFPTNSSINFGSGTKGFGNFGTFGAYPPNPICASCHLERGCVPPNWQHANDLGDESGDQLGRVCRPCQSICGKNYGDLNRPFLVEGRANGRPRVCRKLT
jgi:hypothetical protein